jgi:hypothetical protein
MHGRSPRLKVSWTVLTWVVHQAAGIGEREERPEAATRAGVRAQHGQRCGAASAAMRQAHMISRPRERAT